MHIEHWDRQIDGPLSEAGLREKLESLGYEVSRYVYPPGTHFPDHRHSVDKIDAVLSGTFRIRMGKEIILLHAGDYIRVPRGVTHDAKVIGTEPVVSLDATRSE